MNKLTKFLLIVLIFASTSTASTRWRYNDIFKFQNVTDNDHLEYDSTFRKWVNVSDITLDGNLFVLETATPTAKPGYGSIYPKVNNELFFQDGAGNEHLLHGDSFSGMWFHAASVDTVAISAADTFTLIDSFENLTDEDDLGNTVGSIANSELTIGANGNGEYTLGFHASITSAGANSEMVIVMGKEFATPLSISAATNATPIVITTDGTDLFNGDMVTIVNGTGNTGVNGDWILTAKSTNDFTLLDMQGADSIGNGPYNADSADITIEYSGELLMHRIVSQTDLGVGGTSGTLPLVTGDKIALYVANINATRDLEVAQVTLNVRRIAD